MGDLRVLAGSSVLRTKAASRGVRASSEDQRAKPSDQQDPPRQYEDGDPGWHYALASNCVELLSRVIASERLSGEGLCEGHPS